MRVGVVILGPTVFGQILLKMLNQNGIHPDIVLLETGSERARKIKRWLIPKNDPDPTIDANGRQNVTIVDDLFSKESRQTLKSRDLDYIINGGAGLFDEHYLSLALKCFLNVHPGLLPDFRGLDPVLWALYEKKPIGVTIHQIDNGIDTGDVLISSQLPKQSGYKSLYELRIECMRYGINQLISFLNSPNSFKPKKQPVGAFPCRGKFPEDRMESVVKFMNGS